jgi:hypothetical protein
VGNYTPPAFDPFRNGIAPVDIMSSGVICMELPVALIPYIVSGIEALRWPETYSELSQETLLMIKQIETFIAEIGTNRLLCKPGESGTGENGGATYPQGFEIFSNECEECMNCSVPYGSLKYDDEGKLMYLYCGQWYYPDGTPAGVPGDETIFDWPDDTDPDETTFYPCGMAQAVADMLVDLGEFIWDESDSTIPLLIVLKAQNHIGLDLNNIRTINAVTQALIMKGVLIVSYGVVDLDRDEVIPPDLAEWFACKLAPIMPTDGKGNGDDILSALNSFIGEHFSSYANPKNVFIRNFWGELFLAVGKGSLAGIANAGALNSVGDCACPGEQALYTGGVHFLPEFDTSANPTWVTLMETSNNGRNILIEWSAPDGNYRSDDILRPKVLFDGPHTEVQIIQSAVLGYDTAKNEWFGVGECDGGPMDWVWPRLNVFTTVNRVVYGGGALLITASNATPVSTNRYDFFPRKCPDNPGGGPHIYRMYLSIYSIDGEAV